MTPDLIDRMCPPLPSPAERERIRQLIEAMKPPTTGVDQPMRHVYTFPDGRRLLVSPWEDARAAADQARAEAFARAQGRVDEDHAAPSSPTPVWSRTPSPEQVAARDRAFHTFIGNLPMWSDEGMPRIEWRWLREDDDPIMSRAWGFCRWLAPWHVMIALRVDVSPERTYGTALHELAHAIDHEFLRYGAPRGFLEERAEHLQHVLSE